MAYLDTHYYGGVKNYQWVTIPLAIHGVVAKKDGSVVEICIGEKEDDPVVFVSDLLIHLAAQQMDKKAKVVIEGENLDILIGSRPLAKTEGEEEEKAEDVYKRQVFCRQVRRCPYVPPVRPAQASGRPLHTRRDFRPSIRSQYHFYPPAMRSQFRQTVLLYDRPSPAPKEKGNRWQQEKRT